MTLREALQAVYDRNDQLTPELVVQAARSKDAVGQVLHGRLEWDNKVAGDAYRRQQAQELIRSQRVVYREATDTEEERSIRAFHAVRRESGYTYEPAEKVADDPFTKRVVLNDMEREWKALKRRYERFAEFADMVQQDLAQAA